MRKLLAFALCLFGVALIGVDLWKDRTQIRLILLGEATTGQVVSITRAGTKTLSKSRYNLGGSGPGSVQTFDVAYSFDGPEGPVEGVTVLDFYQIAGILPDFNLVHRAQSIGQAIPVRYLGDMPSLSAVAHPLPLNDFWMPLLAGLTFLILGLLWAFARRPTPTG